MAAVLDSDLQAYQERLGRLRSDEIDVFFKAVSLADRPSIRSSPVSTRRSCSRSTTKAGATTGRCSQGLVT